jgi:hypothetical protein
MSEDSVEAHVRAGAAMLNLQLDETSFAVVVANTHVLRAQQALFMDLDLPDDLDPVTLLRL